MKQVFNQNTLIAFAIGLIVASLGVGYLAFNYTERLKDKYQPQQYSASVQWMIEHPQYAETLKANYDGHMKAAEDAFAKSIGGENEVQGKE